MVREIARPDAKVEREIAWFRITDRMWAARDDGRPAGMIGRELTGEYIAFDRYGAAVGRFTERADARDAVEELHRARLHGVRRRVLVPLLGAGTLAIAIAVVVTRW